MPNALTVERLPYGKPLASVLLAVAAVAVWQVKASRHSSRVAQWSHDCSASFEEARQALANRDSLFAHGVVVEKFPPVATLEWDWVRAEGGHRDAKVEYRVAAGEHRADYVASVVFDGLSGSSDWQDIRYSSNDRNHPSIAQGLGRGTPGFSAELWSEVARRAAFQDTFMPAVQACLAKGAQIGLSSE
jgi:hypothetical protein